MRRVGVLLRALLFAGSTAHAADRAALENIRTEWQNAYGAIIYTVLADVKNVSATPVQYVKVRVALTDKNGQLVAERVGYNMGAEILQQEDVRGSAEEKLKRVTPVAPGAQDIVRISLDKSDIGKPFRSATVTIVEVR